MIEMNDVCKNFGSELVLNRVSFKVNKQEVFGLLGPSGAGKTTIINILNNILSCDSGTHKIKANNEEIGLMLDEDGLFTRLSCKENLEIFARIYNIDKTKISLALREVGLTKAANKAVSELSKGMRQRLALARAILHQPKVLFLDEPTSGLDPGTAKGIHNLIKDIKVKGATIFLTTHNMEEAVKLCDHVALLHKGVIVEQGEPLVICEKYQAIKTVPDLEVVFIKLTGVELE